MKTYCHRGNAYGLNKIRENSISNIEEVLVIGKGEIGVELDFQLYEGKLLCKHDRLPLITDKYLAKHREKIEKYGLFVSMDEIITTYGGRMPLLLELKTQLAPKTLTGIIRTSGIKSYYEALKEVLLKHIDKTDISFMSYNLQLIEYCLREFQGSGFRFGYLHHPFQTTAFADVKPDFVCANKLILLKASSVDYFRHRFGAENTEVLAGCTGDNLPVLEKAIEAGVDAFMTNKIGNALQYTLQRN